MEIYGKIKVRLAFRGPWKVVQRCAMGQPELHGLLTEAVIAVSFSTIAQCILRYLVTLLRASAGSPTLAHCLILYVTGV